MAGWLLLTERAICVTEIGAGCSTTGATAAAEGVSAVRASATFCFTATVSVASADRPPELFSIEQLELEPTNKYLNVRVCDEI